jgi:hypothetical protein
MLLQVWFASVFPAMSIWMVVPDWWQNSVGKSVSCLAALYEVPSLILF